VYIYQLLTDRYLRDPISQDEKEQGWTSPEIVESELGIHWTSPEIVESELGIHR
jgi:hypothetical protein